MSYKVVTSRTVEGIAGSRRSQSRRDVRPRLSPRPRGHWGRGRSAVGCGYVSSAVLAGRCQFRGRWFGRAFAEFISWSAARDEAKRLSHGALVADRDSVSALGLSDFVVHAHSIARVNTCVNTQPDLGLT